VADWQCYEQAIKPAESTVSPFITLLKKIMKADYLIFGGPKMSYMNTALDKGTRAR